MRQTIHLNQGQQEAADGFFEFLFSAEKELIVSGAGGTGKTTLMGDMIDRIMPEYFKACQLMGLKPEFDEVVMTATTNKAAEVLGLATNRPTQTIHSFLSLTVKENFETGQSQLQKTPNWIVHQRKIVFIDEASMIDTTLLTLIREGTHGCKIVFIGDHCQLAPVTETISPIYRESIRSYELKEHVRNAGQPALMAICQQLRNTVETGQFLPIQIVSGVIDHADDDMMQELIAETFSEQNRMARILTYTNKRVLAYNEHIRSLRKLPSEYGKGELLVNTQAIRYRDTMLSIEEEVEIIEQSPNTEDHFISEFNGAGVTLQVRKSTVRSQLGEIYRGLPIPVDRAYFDELVRFYARQKQWGSYFLLRKTFPDLRARDAATVHKAQGSTYDTVFLDMGDISSCHQPRTAARLLYVAFTRARNRVVLYGDLKEDYGGLIH